MKTPLLQRFKNGINDIRRTTRELLCLLMRRKFSRCTYKQWLTLKSKSRWSLIIVSKFKIHWRSWIYLSQFSSSAPNMAHSSLLPFLGILIHVSWTANYWHSFLRMPQDGMVAWVQFRHKIDLDKTVFVVPDIATGNSVVMAGIPFIQASKFFEVNGWDVKSKVYVNASCGCFLFFCWPPGSFFF